MTKMNWGKTWKFRNGKNITDHRQEGEFKDAADRWLSRNDKNASERAAIAKKKTKG
jgi:hypothetical protein